MTKQTFEISGEERTISFIVHGDKYYEYPFSHFKTDFPEFTKEDFDNFSDWADRKCNFYDIEELEYIFPIMTHDTRFLSKLEVPEKLLPIFTTLIGISKKKNLGLPDEEKIVLRLVISFPRYESDTP